MDVALLLAREKENTGFCAESDLCGYPLAVRAYAGFEGVGDLHTGGVFIFD